LPQVLPGPTFSTHILNHILDYLLVNKVTFDLKINQYLRSTLVPGTLVLNIFFEGGNKNQYSRKVIVITFRWKICVDIDYILDFTFSLQTDHKYNF